LSEFNPSGFRRLQFLGATSVRRTLATITGLRQSLGAASPTAFVLYGSLPVLTVMGALVSLIIPRVLGPAQFGQYSLVEALFRYGVTFDLGLSLLVDRRLPALRATVGERELSAFSTTILWFRLYIAFAAVALGALVLLLLSIADALPFRWALGMTALTAGVLGMLVFGPTSIERALSHRRNFAILYAGGLTVLSLGRLVGVLTGGVMGCFAVMGACYFALTVYSHWGILHSREQADAISARASFRESVPLFLTTYAYTLTITSNRWVVASRADPDSFGHFAFGTSVITLLVGVVGGMAQLWYPFLARQLAMGEAAFVSRRVLRDMGGLAIAAAIISMMGVWLSPWLISLIYPKFGSSLGVIRIILASFPAATITAWLLPLALATGARPWLDGVLLYFAALVLLVATTEAGFQMGGIPGASWGLIVSMPCVVGLQLWRLHGRHVMRWRDAIMLFVVIIFATAAPVMTLFSVEGVT
jgi:O-antigen/teichoic acid export membrane protein